MSQQLDSQQPLDEEKRNRLWEHGLHAENVFNNQLYFFLIFESLLLSGVITAVLPSHQSSGKPVLLGIAAFGFLVAFFWLAVQYNQGYLFEQVKERLKNELPEYKETLRQRKEGRTWLLILVEAVTNLKVLVVAIPGFVGLLWVGLFIYISLV